MKNTIFAIIILVLVGGFGYYYMEQSSVGTDVVQTGEIKQVVTATSTATTTQPAPTVDKTQTEIGTSAGNKKIFAYHFGTGDKELLFVGGIHGGYEWNTSLLAYELMDYLKANPTKVPSGVKVTIIPVLNPDGLAKVTGTTERFTKDDVASSESIQISGRFNANTVDLNRNFDCDWKAKGTWQTRTVSGGSAPFSEPESKAIQAYISKNPITAAVVYYSQAGGVYASNCHSGVLPETSKLTQAYAKASGYPAHESFDFYATTGDMVNWLAKMNTPAISVLLTNHTDTEFAKNTKGLDAVLDYYAR